MGNAQEGDENFPGWPIPRGFFAGFSQARRWESPPQLVLSMSQDSRPELLSFPSHHEAPKPSSAANPGSKAWKNTGGIIGAGSKSQQQPRHRSLWNNNIPYGSDIPAARGEQDREKGWNMQENGNTLRERGLQFPSLLGETPQALKSLPVHPKMGNPVGIAGWEHQGCFRLRLRQGLSHSSRNSQVGRAGNIHGDKEAAMSSPSQTTATSKGGRRRMETPGKILHSHIRISPSTASQEQHSSRTWSFPEQQLLEHGRAASRDLGTASCQEEQLHPDPSNYS